MELKLNLGISPIALFVVFLILKLCNVITWSWLWVTAPLWVAAGLVATFFGGWFLVVIIIIIVAKIRG